MLLMPKITSNHLQKSNKKSIPFFVKKDNRDNRLPMPKAQSNRLRQIHSKILKQVHTAHQHYKKYGNYKIQ